MKKFIHKVFSSQDSLANQPHRPVSQDYTLSFHSGYRVAYGDTQQTLDAPPGSLNIALKNHTTSNTVFAYVTGLALNNNNAPVLLQSDGKTLYYPQSPPSTCTPLSVNCAIPLGAPGSTVTVTIPKIAGGRIWFSIDEPLTFLVNPGPALVEPSVTSFSDPNINIAWAFCEFTYNNAQLFANISYVDFVSIPIALTLISTSDGTQHVAGMPADGLATVCDGLRKQAAIDHQPWDQLIYNHNGHPLRALSPNNLLVSNPNAFSGYWEPYIQQVWSRFSCNEMRINTQAAFGSICGKVKNGALELSAAGSFPQPSGADIFSCSTGPFATGNSTERNVVIPRLAAAFNRSTLLLCDEHPNGAHKGQYYNESITNHYSRVIHEVNVDSRGYAFPYDDVTPDGGHDQCGAVMDGSPRLFIVAFGGASVHG